MGKETSWAVWKQWIKGAIFGHLEGGNFYLQVKLCVPFGTDFESIDVNLAQMLSVWFLKSLYLQTQRA